MFNPISYRGEKEFIMNKYNRRLVNEDISSDS